MLVFSNTTTSLLDKMTDKERKALLMFVKSKYFNDSTAKIPLLLAFMLKVLYKNKAAKIIDKAILLRKWFDETYPNEVFEVEKEDANFNALLSDINTLILDFLVINHIQSNPFLKKRYLLEELRKRDLLEFIKPEAYESSHVASVESVANYITHWEIQDHIDRYYEAFLQRKSPMKNNIAQAAQALDVAFLANKLRYICIALNHNHIFPNEEPIKIIGEALVQELNWL